MEDSQARDILALTTTVGNLADAQALARGLVVQRLAACVQLEPGVQSVYRWEGKVCEEAEVRLTVKTLPDRRQAIEAFLAEKHPYDLPQVTWVVMSASAAYAAWVAQAVSLTPTTPTRTPAR